MEKAEFPHYVLDRLRDNGVVKRYIKSPHGISSSMMLQGVLTAESARVDASLGTFITVQGCLAMFTVESFGSEE